MRRSVLALIALFLLAGLSQGQTASSSEAIVFEEKAVSKKVTGNGLTILASRSQPLDLVAIDISVRAGSSLEADRPASGISHFVEHMVFKGTKTRKVGEIEREVKSLGGSMNGSVSRDLARFYLVLPSKNFEKALVILKDMLLNATFDKAELEKEREVILNEIRLDNDEPGRRLDKILNETAYLRHPYRYPPIGYEERFRALTRDDLLRYYNRMYVPDRMVIAVVGGVAPQDAVKSVEDVFKDFRKPGYTPLAAGEEEPQQIGMRRAEDRMPVNLAYLALGYHSTRLLDRDLFAMDVLSMILGRGNNSRLNERLFKDERAVHSISSWNYTPYDPGLFAITAVTDGDKVAQAEELIFEEVAKLHKTDVSDEELEAAKRMVLSDFLFARQTIESQAADLSTNEMYTASYDFSSRYVSGVQAVTKQDIRRAATQYLVKDNCSIARILPQGEDAAASAPSQAAAIEERVSKETLPNGLHIIIREDRKTPTVSITVAALGGLWSENASNNGISNLSSRMLLKGTARRKEADIAGAIEKRGGNIDTFSGLNGFGIGATFLKDDTDMVIDILRDIVTASTFPREELMKEMTLTLASIKQEDSDVLNVGSNALRKEFFGDHPYGMRVIGEPASVSVITSDDVSDFVKAYLVPNNMVISVAGDIDTAAMINKLTSAFGPMKARDLPHAAPKPEKPAEVKSRTIEMEKEESALFMAFDAPLNNDPDRYAFEVLSSILSGSSGRLFHSLRAKESLAYSLGCALKSGPDAGYFLFYVATSEDRLDAASKALNDQIQAIRTAPVPDEELALAKRELISDQKSKLQTNEYRSFHSAIDELYGLGYDAFRVYAENIEKVTSQDIQLAVQKYLTPGSYAEVVVRSKPK